MPDEWIEVGPLGKYFEARMQYEAELQIATLGELLLAAVQLGYYWDEFKEAIDNRDDVIDNNLIPFMDYLRNGPRANDLGMIANKQGVRDGLAADEPTADNCLENIRYRGEVTQDGNAVDKSARRFAKESCCGIPEGWGIHDGDLAAVLSVPIEGSYQAAAADRRRQEFLKNEVGLVQAAQRSIKATINASSILAYYERAIAIYQGLGDMFIQGFNSAGAALGVALGKLAHTSSAPTSSTSSGIIQIGHTGSGQPIT